MPGKGGFTCCVPGCFKNNKVHRHLSFYNFPKDEEQKKIWIKNIGRQGSEGKFSEFKPTSGHRVCSEHFVDGKKSYMVKVPTIFPLKQPTTSTPRRKPVERNLSFGIEPISLETMETEDTNDRLDADGLVEFQHGDHSYTGFSSATTREELLKTLKSKTADQCEMSHRITELEEQVSLLKTENDNNKKTITLLTADNLRQKRKFHSLNMTYELFKRECRQKNFSMECIKDRPDSLKFYTGFSSFEEYLHLYNFLQPDFKNLRYWGSREGTSVEKAQTKRRLLSHHDELLMVLSRLRVGLMCEDLAFRFGVHRSTVSRICRTYFDLMYRRFREIPIFGSRELIQKDLPPCFREHYPTTRIILDCTELFIQTPSHFRVQSETYSSYKSHNTAKGLVGISPNGFISFVTDLCPGRMSDKVLTEASGLVDLLDEGDSVMADRGFVIDEYLARKKVKLNIPPFMSGKSQLSPAEEDETRQVASVIIHVERVIERIKNFQILNQVFPNSMASELNKVWVICCYLVNFTIEPILGTDNI